MIGLPRGRERLHRGRTAHLADAARGDLRRDQDPHPRDRPVGADPATAATGTTAAPSRASSTATSCRVPGRRPGRLDPAASADGRRRARRASRCCSTATQLAEGHEFFSLGGSTSAPTATCWPTRPTRSATSGTRCGSGTCAPERTCADEIAGVVLRRHLGRPTASTLFYIDRRRRLARRQGLAARGSAPRRPTTSSWSPRGPTSGSGSASAAPDSDRVPDHRVGSQDHHRGTAPRRRRPEPASSGSWPPRREGVEYAVDHAHRRRGLSWSLHNDAAPRLRARQRAARRDRARALAAADRRTTRAMRLRGRRRVRRATWCCTSAATG